MEDFVSLSTDTNFNKEGILKGITTYNESLPSLQNRDEQGCLPEWFICIDWYWVTYVNGILVNQEFLYTTCECMGPTGGGGSAGPPPNPAAGCASQISAMISQGMVQSQLISSMESGEDQYGYNVVYTWRIYSAGSWGLLSYEDARVKKIPSVNNGYIKAYESFTHRNIAAVGASIGGTRTAQDMGATINMTQSRANVRIDFIVTHAPAGCLSVPIPYNATNEFRLLNNVVIE